MTQKMTKKNGQKNDSKMTQNGDPKMTPKKGFFRTLVGRPTINTLRVNFKMFGMSLIDMTIRNIIPTY